MKAPTNVLFVFGTRPEAVKLAPVIKELEAYPDSFKSIVCVTAQHREMLDQALDLFQIRPDYDLKVMVANQTLENTTAKVLEGVGRVIAETGSELIIVQGDTTTTFASSLAAFYAKKKVAHVEAGLRTMDKFRPFPEEVNRRICSILSDLHFAPTDKARTNLLKEGVDPSSIHIVGNTVVDALHSVKAKLRSHSLHALVSQVKDCQTVLVTAHRRESFGPELENICHALSKIAERPGTAIIFPVHLNPKVRDPVFRLLSGKKDIYLVEPLDYVSFLQLLEASDLVLTDSGGVQEEAPTFGKPVLVLREVTERPEGVEAGVAKIVGTSYKSIVESVSVLLNDRKRYSKMVANRNPYGDGNSAKRIVKILRKWIHKDSD